MASANTTGGVMGKMIDAQSIVVASTATHQVGNEAAIFKAVFWHSMTLASLVGVLVMLYAYVWPWVVPHAVPLKVLRHERRPVFVRLTLAALAVVPAGLFAVQAVPQTPPRPTGLKPRRTARPPRRPIRCSPASPR